MQSSRRTWPSSRRRNARMTMSIIQSYAMWSSRKLSWPLGRRPRGRVSRRRLRSVSASNLRPKINSTNCGKTWSERSRKWQSVWIYPSRSKRRLLGFKRQVSPNTTSRRPSTSSRLNTWRRRFKVRMKKKGSWFKSSRSKRLRLQTPTASPNPNTRRRSVRCQPK